MVGCTDCLLAVFTLHLTCYRFCDRGLHHHNHVLASCFLLCARGLQQHRVTVFMLLLLCKMFTIASFNGFLSSLFLSEVYCNMVFITGSCRQCCIQRYTSSSCYGVHVIVCKRFTASSCYWLMLSLFCQRFTALSC